MRKTTAVLSSVLMLAGSVLTGCSRLAAGQAVPADSDGPRPVLASALPEVLLEPGMVNDIMGASSMTVRDSTTRLFDGRKQFRVADCMIAWTPAEQSVYARSGWRAVLAQTLLETRGVADHFVIQAVVDFPSRTAARSFFDEAALEWKPCGDRTFTTPRRGSDSNVSWTFDAVYDTDSTLWMKQNQIDSTGWSCQRALRISNNVAIDVLACKEFAIDEAVTIAEGIDARLPSV